MKINRNNPNVQASRHQAGMTLIELAVVLLILVGLAGLMLPYVADYSGKTHDSTAAANVGAINAAITRFQNETGRFPSNMDSLLTTPDTPGSAALIDYTVANKLGSTPASAYGLTVTDLSAAGNSNLCKSLYSAGIASVVSMADPTAATPIAAKSGTFAPTFNNSAGLVQIAHPPMLTTIPTTNTALTGSNGSCQGAIATIAEGASCSGAACKVATALGLDPAQTQGKTYAVFGIGDLNEMMGNVMTAEAPVHYSKQTQHNAANAYNRFVVLFQLDPTNGNAAKFMGSTMLMSSLVGNGGDKSVLGSWYSSAMGNN